MRAGGTRRWSRIRLSAPTVEPAANAAHMKPASLRSPPRCSTANSGKATVISPSPPSPIAAAAVMPRSSGIETIWRIPAAATPSRVPSPRRPSRSRSGMRRIRTRATSARPASTSSEVSGPKAPDSPPASAGPTTSALLKLVVSSALAGASRSSGTSTGMKLVKPPKDSG